MRASAPSTPQAPATGESTTAVISEGRKSPLSLPSRSKNPCRPFCDQTQFLGAELDALV